MMMLSRKMKWLIALMGVGALVALPAVPAGAAAVPHASVGEPSGVPREQAAIARPAGSFVALTSARILDTRSGIGASGTIAAGGSLAITVLGRGGVPSSGVAAVALNLIAISPTSGGALTAYPDNTPWPGTTNLSFVAGQTAANLAMVAVGADGKVRIRSNGRVGTVQVVADVSGYYTAGSPVAAGSFQAITPARVADTRFGRGIPAAKVDPQSVALVRIGGVARLPKMVAAVAIDVTTIASLASGSITVYPTGSPRLSTPDVNFVPRRDTTSLVIVPVWSDGRISLYNGSTQPVDLVVDVVGYYLNTYSGQIGTLQTIPQQRLVDMPRARTTLATGRSLTVPVAGQHGIPEAGTSAVAVNVTVVNPAYAGDIRAFAGTAVPNTSNLNFDPGHTASNVVVVPVVKGSIQLYNDSRGAVQLQVDVVGVFWDGSGAARCNAVPIDASGTAITRWNPLVKCILAVLGQSQAPGNVSDVDTIIQYESSGDPNAINNYDINWQEGHPSEGLIQVIKPTFDTYRSPLLANILLNPAANLYAGLNYAIHTYGSIHNVPGLISLRGGGPYQGYIKSS